jgi:hypothetical protein
VQVLRREEGDIKPPRSMEPGHSTSSLKALIQPGLLLLQPGPWELGLFQGKMHNTRPAQGWLPSREDKDRVRSGLNGAEEKQLE